MLTKKFYHFKKKKILWKVVLDFSSIFSAPSCTESTVFVTTLGGNLFSIDESDGSVNWKFRLDKPVFTSPVINEREKTIFTGTCSGCLYCIQFNNELVS